MRKDPYNDKLMVDVQLDAEEAIAAYLFDELGHIDDFSEGIAHAMGKDLLYMVLKRFRSDILHGKEDEFCPTCKNKYLGIIR